MRSMSLLLLTARWAPARPRRSPAARAEAEAHLNKLLAGKVAGQAARCLPHYRADDMVVIDDNTVVFKRRPDRLSQRLPGRRLLATSAAAFTRWSPRSVGGTGLCRGDIAEVLDTSSTG